MRSRLRIFGAVGLYAVLALLSIRVQADPWYSDKGLASYYGKEFQGKKTARGERFSPTEMTAAHRNLPLGTKVIVENLETGAKTEVKITDRSPYADQRHRLIDLSKAAADSLGLVEQGVGGVQVTVTEASPDEKKSSQNEAMFFEVQVGAFEDSEQAERVLEQVKPWFPKAYIAPHEGPGREYYRVRVGPFASKEDTQRIANSLKRGGHHVFLDEVPEGTVPEETSREVKEAVDAKTR